MYLYKHSHLRQRDELDIETDAIHMLSGIILKPFLLMMIVILDEPVKKKTFHWSNQFS